MNEVLLVEYCRELGISLSAGQIKQFSRYFEELLAWNQKFNLTAITDEQGVHIKHFVDSLLGSQTTDWQGSGSLLDLGTGAGFPGLPLKIVCPDLEVTLVDSLLKRVGFLKHMIEVLGLKGVRAIHARAEDLGQDKNFRERYDYVVSRAVAKMPVLCEYCLPLVKVGGQFLAYKGPEGSAELSEAENALQILGGELKETFKGYLPNEGGERYIFVVRKSRPTPAKYPRKAGTAVKKPL